MNNLRLYLKYGYGDSVAIACIRRLPKHACVQGKREGPPFEGQGRKDPVLKSWPLHGIVILCVRSRSRWFHFCGGLPWHALFLWGFIPAGSCLRDEPWKRLTKSWLGPGNSQIWWQSRTGCEEISSSEGSFPCLLIWGGPWRSDTCLEICCLYGFRVGTKGVARSNDWV